MAQSACASHMRFNCSRQRINRVVREINWTMQKPTSLYDMVRTKLQSHYMQYHLTHSNQARKNFINHGPSRQLQYWVNPFRLASEHVLQTNFISSTVLESGFFANKSHGQTTFQCCNSSSTIRQTYGTGQVLHCQMTTFKTNLSTVVFGHFRPFSRTPRIHHE